MIFVSLWRTFELVSTCGAKTFSTTDSGRVSVDAGVFFGVKGALVWGLLGFGGGIRGPARFIRVIGFSSALMGVINSDVTLMLSHFAAWSTGAVGVVGVDCIPFSEAEQPGNIALHIKKVTFLDKIIRKFIAFKGVYVITHSCWNLA